MRVISKLAQIDFRFGEVKRQGNVLVIDSHPDSKMRSTVYLSPEDVIEYLKRLIVSPSSLLFFLGLPFFWYRWRRSGEEAGRSAQKKVEWPTV